jgi:hypothetical protein
MSVSQSLSLIGVVLIVLGLGCFPVGYRINPVRDLSMFENLVDLGLFWKVGVMLVGIGIAFLLVGGMCLCLRKVRPSDVILTGNLTRNSKRPMYFAAPRNVSRTIRCRSRTSER